MPPKHERFAYEYCRSLNASQAAVAAGMGPGAGQSLLRSPGVQWRVAQLMEARARRCRISADDVIAGLKRVLRKAEAAERFGDAIRALELLGKHLRMFGDGTYLRPEDMALSELSHAELQARIAAIDRRRAALMEAASDAGAIVPAQALAQTEVVVKPDTGTGPH